MRTQREALIDRILLLYVIAKVNEYGMMEGPFKLMKVPFLSQRAMNSEGEKGFSYTFFRWDFGPLSTEIYDDRDALTRCGYVTQVGSKGRIYPTEDGIRLLESLGELFAENADIVKKIDREAKKCADLSFAPLKNLVYGTRIQVADRQLPVRDAPRGAQVLGKIDEGEVKERFEIDEDWLDSLCAVFDTTAEKRAKLGLIRKAG